MKRSKYNRRLIVLSFGLLAAITVATMSFLDSGSELEGRFPSVTSGCPTSYTNVFEGNVDTTNDFIDLLTLLDRYGVKCPYQLSANMEPYSSSYHVNTAFTCDASTLDVFVDSSTDSYQIECEQETNGVSQALRANLSIDRDSSGAIIYSSLGVNMDLVTDHTYINTTLDSDTFRITKLNPSRY